ncbi:S8 family peptidase [Actinomadura madurae]|uniref:S8 family peptidase n=1 Tax=Actinomadura madurae TaxID=1993 RepID=UPI0020264B83|nr:S8 family serine peptidase [Actinomadura madurae]MCQ0008413.1 S8 family serine peptidase [Actinomadura madurae]URN07061.1 S8 family serine peptidase [Actinomadura madurae]
MRGGRIAAGTASLALTSGLAFAPAAAAAPAAPADRPRAAPTPTKKPAKPKKTQQRAPAPKCNKQIGQPASAITIEPWAQRRLDFEQAWPITRGGGVTVAVVDSGINAAHPQLKGKVAASFDASGTTTDDCLGHGTEVAGIIAATDMRNRDVPFVGVAPQVKLLNAKFASGESTQDNTLLPKAITWAAEHGAKVINVSSAAPDTPALRAAVQAAQRRDVLIVAAAGNVAQDQRGKESAAYPASYKGVLSVAAVDEAGTITGFSNIKTRIDVSAPGQNVISTLGNGYAGGLQGTSFGAPYATGVAALVRAKHPDLNYQQVINRILITAEGGNGQGSGHGMISPLQAVSGLVDPNARPGAADARPLSGAVPIAKPEPVDHRARTIGLVVAGGALAAALLVALGGAVIPLGRRRGWRPGRAVLPAEERD